jgi:hypothetical protein
VTALNVIVHGKAIFMLYCNGKPVSSTVHCFPSRRAREERLSSLMKGFAIVQLTHLDVPGTRTVFGGRSFAVSDLPSKIPWACRIAPFDAILALTIYFIINLTANKARSFKYLALYLLFL